MSDKATRWLLCPKCHSKTRLMLRDDTELKNFPLYCPKCHRETLINLKKCKIEILEPDVFTQSR